jgi:hypothetical protein
MVDGPLLLVINTKLFEFVNPHPIFIFNTQLFFGIISNFFIKNFMIQNWEILISSQMTRNFIWIT